MKGLESEGLREQGFSLAEIVFIALTLCGSAFANQKAPPVMHLEKLTTSDVSNVYNSLIFPFGDKGYVPNDSLYEKQGYLKQIGWDKAALKTRGNPNIEIAILDSGYDTEHEDLEGKAVSDWNFIKNNADVEDDWGHGTNITGIPCAVIDNEKGIAGITDSKFKPLKVIDATGFARADWIALAIKWAADNGAKIINMSLGGSQHWQPLENAVNYAYNKGVFLVACAMNDNKNIDDNPIYPICYDGVFGVGGLDANNQRWPKSNYGKKNVNVYTYATNILTTDINGGYTLVGGASDAAAIVSGLASLVLDAHPEFTPQQIKKRLLESADTVELDVGTTLRLNARKAVIDNDLSVASINSGDEANGNYEPIATVNNWGFYDFEGKVVAEILKGGSKEVVYADTQDVNLKRDENREINFREWRASDIGEYKLRVSNITEDEISENNELEKTISVAGIAERKFVNSLALKLSSIAHKLELSYTLPSYTPAVLEIYGSTGRKVKNLKLHRLKGNVKFSLPSGVYFLILRAGERKVIKKGVVVR